MKSKKAAVIKFKLDTNEEAPQLEITIENPKKGKNSSATETILVKLDTSLAAQLKKETKVVAYH